MAAAPAAANFKKPLLLFSSVMESSCGSSLAVVVMFQLLENTWEPDDDAGADGLGVNAGVEDRQATVAELGDAPVDTRNQRVVNATDGEVAELGGAGRGAGWFRAASSRDDKWSRVIYIVLIMADADESFDIRLDGQDVRPNGKSRADVAGVEPGGAAGTQDEAAGINAGAEKNEVTVIEVRAETRAVDPVAAAAAQFGCAEVGVDAYLGPGRRQGR